MRLLVPLLLTLNICAQSFNRVKELVSDLENLNQAQFTELSLWLGEPMGGLAETSFPHIKTLSQTTLGRSLLAKHYFIHSRTRYREKELLSLLKNLRASQEQETLAQLKAVLNYSHARQWDTAREVIVDKELFLDRGLGHFTPAQASNFELQMAVKGIMDRVSQGDNPGRWNSKLSEIFSEILGRARRIDETALRYISREILVHPASVDHYPYLTLKLMADAIRDSQPIDTAWLNFPFWKKLELFRQYIPDKDSFVALLKDYSDELLELQYSGFECSSVLL